MSATNPQIVFPVSLTLSMSATHYHDRAATEPAATGFDHVLSQTENKPAPTPAASAAPTAKPAPVTSPAVSHKKAAAPESAKAESAKAESAKPESAKAAPTADASASITAPAATPLDADEKDAIAAVKALVGNIETILTQRQAASPVTGSDAVTPKDGDDAAAHTPDNATLAQLLAQLAASLNTLVPPAPAATGSDGVAGTAGATDALSASLADAASLLNRFAQDLLGKSVKDSAAAALPSSTPDVAAAPAASAQATSQSNAPSLTDFAATLATLQSTLARVAHSADASKPVGTSLLDALKHAEPHISALAAPTPPDAQDTASDTAEDGTNTTAQPSPLPVAPASQQAAPAVSGGFATLLNAAASAHASAADQVVVKIRSVEATGDSQIKIQLNPLELGKVDVQLTTGSDGKTSVTVTADNRQTLQLLQQEAKSLEAALRDIGMKTDTGGLNFNLREQQQQTRQQTKQGGYTAVNAIGDESDAAANTTSYALALRPGLDIQA